MAIDFSKVDFDTYASSLGLAFTPPLPQGVETALANGGKVVAKKKSITGEEELENEDEEETAGQKLRNENREKKNVNRGLDKLKRQIKEAKVKKKIERVLHGLGLDPESNEGKEKFAELLDEFKLHEMRKEVQKDSSRQTNARSFHVAAEEAINSDSEDELLVKKVDSKPLSSADMMRQKEEDERLTREASMLSMGLGGKKKKKEKPLKINADGVAKAVIRADASSTGSAKARKIHFDEDGEAILRNGLSLYEKANEHRDLDMDGIAEYTAQVKSRVDAGRKEDEIREKERVQAKKKKYKEDAKGKKGEGNDKDVEGGEATVMLASYDSDFI